jgi:hypothetical protein
MTAIILEDETFASLEFIHGAAVEAIVPPERLDKFEEFHAWELYGGYGVFDGVEQVKRFFLIESLLKIISEFKVSIVYGAVHKAKMEELIYGSADPVDICFRVCVKGVQDWIRQLADLDIALLIVDDWEQKDIKRTIRKSFRQMRKHSRAPQYEKKQAWLLHDDMYFGDSKDSIGLQLADLCGYIIGKHLKGDVAAGAFYEIIKGNIFYSQVEPKETA